MNQYHSEEQYLEELQRNSCLPGGFSISVQSIRFVPEEKQDGPEASMNMTAIVLDEPTESFAGVFTKNAFPGAPVRIGRRLLEETAVQGVLINNKISNVCTPQGEDDAHRVLHAFTRAMKGKIKAPLFPSSTGVIGWSLPVKAMCEQAPELAAALNKDSLLPAAKAIMTTDSFPKLRSVPLGEGRISGIAKGAGMIEPNMATMLSFLLTDVSVPRDMMRRVLSRVVDRTYNTISVDSDQSTSDSVLFFSSGVCASVTEEELEKALMALCLPLSEDIVRNGEGCGHVIKVMVEGAASESQARGFAKALVNSPLSKTAVFGNDPNVGRFIQALGDYAGNHGVQLDEEKVSLSLGDETIYSGGRFRLDNEKEKRLSGYLKERALPAPCPGYPVHDKTVEIFVDLGIGGSRARVTGSDLSYEYVRENADYRT
ncbi:MAG: bifunctional ornithine acetyltransferase/N-acetylglutamate synthase [Spirochaetales bacterium]|nr:bifunctional ornithine acetyltransferase/N-acetylglutamate synthase [Spirochaetales bacterium]